MKVLDLFEGVDKRPQSKSTTAAESAANELRKKGHSVIIRSRVVGKDKSSRNVMVVSGADLNDDAILKVLKKHKVPYATVRSQVKGDKQERMIRLVEEVIKVEEPGWYVCDAKERPVRGPMDEMKAKTIADRLSVDGKKFSAEYFSDYEVSRMDEGVALPFKRFKKGQVVTVKKTGQQVKVLRQNEIGLVQTVKVGGGVPEFPKGKGSVVQAKDHKEYMPQELGESRNSPKEDIPPYAVCLSKDGVVRKDDVYMGSKEDCKDYIRKNKAPKGMNFDIMHIDSGRLVSYML
jgi:hypothetical protein